MPASPDAPPSPGRSCPGLTRIVPGPIVGRAAAAGPRAAEERDVIAVLDVDSVEVGTRPGKAKGGADWGKGGT